MPVYTFFEYSEMIRLYCQNGCIAVHAAQAYAEQYPNAPHKPAPKTIQRTWSRLVETGSVIPNKRECGARRTVLTVQKEDSILDHFINDGKKSLREVARETGVSTRSVGRVLKRERMHPFHYTRVQCLLDTDRAARVEFCEWVLQQEARAPGFLQNILFTDEATFQKNGFCNQRNNHFWSQENPFVVDDTKSIQTRCKKNVWMGIIGGKLVSQKVILLRSDFIANSTQY